MGCHTCKGRTYAEHLRYIARGVAAHRYVSRNGRIG
jgi:hypothetical protein